LVVEIQNSGTHWMEPRDLHVTQMARQINPPRGQGISSPHGPHPTGGANVVMADGTVKFLDTKALTADQIEGLLTIAGGEQVKTP
jgi:prepilin-type processing-associated H-X9-DG protein